MSASGLLRAAWPPIALGAGLIALALLIGASDTAQPLIYVILAVGLYVFVGNSGLISFGHIGFMALGAYAGALLTMPVTTKEILLPDLPGFLGGAHLSTVPAILLAALFVGVVAYLVAIPLMRLSGLAASIATLSLLVIIQDVLHNYEALTGGAGTLTGIPTETTETMLVVWALIAIAVAFAYQRSRFGLRLRASREDEVASRAVGIRVERERRIAFTLSAMVMAAAGVLYAQYLGSLTASAFYLELTFLVVAMLVVGGQRSLTGAVVGAVVLAAFATIFDRLEAGEGFGPLAITLPDGSREILFGIFVIAVLIWRPDGITRGREVPWPFTGRVDSALRGLVELLPTKRPLGKKS